MSDTTKTQLIAQLRTLLQLTQSEIQLATVRQAQARTDAVRKELAQNAKNAQDRSRRISDALQDLGAAPDVISPVVGRLAAMIKSTAEQAQPITEALLGELAMEHQMLDRARYVKVLAERAGESKVKHLAERLETAHSATVEWLTVVLAEDALGGPTALRRTPSQLVTSVALRVVSLPQRTIGDRVNDAFAQARAARQQISDTVSQTRQTAADLRDGVVEVFDVTRDTGLERAELVARRDGANDTAEAVHELRRANGSLNADELPIKRYDDLNISDAVAAINKLTDPEDIRAILAYEEANKGRNGVVSATQTQLASVAKEAVGIS
ncbi:MAG: ferritin-like domain-containing protein [Actinomycetota bacterium]|nr:ferritin-like domain-containing protein [Actinomycetota bacterium]